MTSLSDLKTEHPKWVHRCAILLACTTFPLIWVGGLVTTYDAGMAVPDWPNTYGYNMFLYPPTTWLSGPWDLLIEHGHRLLGSLAGLVAITADPASPSPLMSTIVGAVGGVLVVLSIVTLDKLKIDDPVGAISVHGTVGIWGVLAVCITGGASFLGQLGGLLTIFVWVFVTSMIVWFVIKAIMGIRVSEEEEFSGVDISECGMEAYPEFVTSKS